MSDDQNKPKPMAEENPEGGARKDGRIRPGERRNPAGRPKGRKNNKTLIQEAFLAPVLEMPMNGKKRKLSKKEVAFHQVGNMAARGDLKAFDRMNELLDRYGDVEEAEPTDEEHAADLSVMEHIYSIHERFGRKEAGNE